MARLKASTRKRMKATSFALPGQKKYPIPDKTHARLALAMVAAHGTAAEKRKVRAAVKKKFPTINQSKGRM